MNNAMHSYKQTQFNTIGRADLTVMLYDGAIRFLEQAQEKMLEKDMQAKGNLISRAIDIIQELDSSLNVAQGGEMAQKLHQLYFLSTKNLLMANLKLDISMIQSVQDNMTRLRDSFAEAMQTPEAKAMLQQMGPLSQATTGSLNKLSLGGSINQRAEQIKQTKSKAEALELAKNKLASATTQEEIQLAQKEIATLLQKANTDVVQKVVPTALAQKASLAFTKTSTQLKPVAQVEAVSPLLNTGTRALVNNSPPVNSAKKTAIYANTQGQVAQNPSHASVATQQSTQQNTPVQTGQSTPSAQVTQTTTITPTPLVNNPSTIQTSVQTVASKHTQDSSSTINPQESDVPQVHTPNASALLNRKMALYKNIHTA